MASNVLMASTETEKKMVWHCEELWKDSFTSVELALTHSIAYVSHFIAYEFLFLRFCSVQLSRKLLNFDAEHMKKV